MTPERPIIRYHGGKWRLAPWIISHFPAHQIYVEPFMGAGSVLLQKPRSTVEVANDKFDRVVNLFRVLRGEETADALATLLRWTACSEREYHAARQQSEDAVEDARRLIVLGHQSHGSTGAAGGKLSGWRRGVRPHGPCTANEWAELWKQVETWADRLRGVYLECGDAADVIRRWDSNETLHYIDPPYLTETRTTGAVGYRHEMTNAEHRSLAQLLNEVRGGVIISGYASTLYDELFQGWSRKELKTQADARVSRTEVLWLNERAAGALHPDLFGREVKV